MAKVAPNPIDIQEFQFKLHCCLKIFNNEDANLFAKPCNLVACASQYGLIFVGTNCPEFQVIPIDSIEKYNESNYRRRRIPLPSLPKHLAVNCDNTKLAVVTERDGCALAIVYDITSFTKQVVSINTEICLSIKLDVSVLEICWNPTIPNVFIACKNDGTLGVYEIKETGVDINELPIEAQATCVSWSPKGKQLAVGSRNGKITQYKPDLKAMKVISAPPLEGTQHVIALQWISNYQFIAVFKPPDPNSSASLLVIESPKTGDTVYTNYEDICYGYGSVRPAQFYSIFQPAWNLLLVASSNSMEVGVMGCQGDEWTQWILTDTARAELPLTPTKQESLPVGLAFDIAATEPVIWGETVLPPAPFLLMLSHQGLLCRFRVINMKNNVPNICLPPEILPYGASFNEFDIVSAEPKKTESKPAQFIQPVKPIAGPIAPSVIQPVKTEAEVAPPPLVLSTVPTTQPVKAPPETPPLVITPIVSETNIIQREADMLITNLIREECETLEAELKSLLYKASLVKIDLGTDAEAVDLVRETDTLQEFLAEVVETNTSQSSEIHALKQTLIQTWAWYEDARFRLAQTRDTTLEALLRLQQLDPVSQRYLVDIKQLAYYLDSQLKQASQVIDDQWSDFQDKCKKVVRLKVPTMETIYQAMVRHSIILEKQKYILKDIANRNRALRSRLSGPSILMSLNSADLLEKSLKRLQLEPEQHFLEAQYEMVMQKRKHFTQSKIDKLRTLLKHRNITNIKINKPQLSTNVSSLQTLLQSSPALKNSLQASLIGAGLSPIITKSSISGSNTFVQSTPKPITNINVADVNNANGSWDQKVAIVTSLTSGTEHSQPKFSFAATQPNSTSAFVPTTQLTFSFSNKTNTTTSVTTSISTPFSFGGISMFSFGTSATSPTPITKITSSSNSFSERKEVSPTNQVSIVTSSSIVPSFVATQSLFTLTATKTTPTRVSFVSKNPSTSTSTFKASTPSTTFAFSIRGTDSIPVFSFGPSASVVATASTSVTTTPSWFSNTGKATESSSGFGSVVSGSGSAFSIPSSVSLNSTSSATTVNTELSTTTLSKAFISTTLPPSSVAFIPPSISESSTSVASIFSKADTATTATSPSVISIFSRTDPVNTTSSLKSFSFSPDKITPISTVAVGNPTEVKSSSSLATFTFTTPGTVLSSPNTPVNMLAPILPSPKSGPALAAISASSNNTTLFNSGTSIIKSPSENKSIFGGSSNLLAKTITTGPLISPTVSELKPFGSSNTASIDNTVSVFFDNSATTKPSVFDANKPTSFFEASPTSPGSTTTSETKPVFGGYLNTKSDVVVTTASTISSSSDNKPSLMFSSKTPSTTSTLFTAVTAGQPFGSSNTQNIFASASDATSSTSSIFTMPVSSSNAQQIFDDSKKLFGSTPVFGSSLKSTPATIPSGFSFGTAVTANNSLFTSATTTATGSIFGNTTNTTSLFGSSVSSPISSSPFGTPATTTSIFGNVTVTTTAAFESSPFTNAAASIFGSAATKATPFAASPTGFARGQQTTFGTGTVFGSPETTSTNTFGANNSVFGSSQSPGNTNFAAAGFTKPFSFATPPVPTNSTSFGFGSLNMGSNEPFSGPASNPFAKPFEQEQKPFGGGSLFSTPTTTTTPIFGSGSPSSFGFGSSSNFGSPLYAQQPSFGQTPFASQSQSGPFSGGNQSVAQTGFGGFGQQSPQKTGFGAAPVFGGSPSGFGSPPNFGSSPAFGGTAFNSSFGTPPNKMFENSSNPPTGAFVTPAQHQNPTFANLATQNTIGFGALAQQSPPPPQTNQSSFGSGSSFSTWR